MLLRSLRGGCSPRRHHLPGAVRLSAFSFWRTEHTRHRDHASFSCTPPRVGGDSIRIGPVKRSYRNVRILSVTPKATFREADFSGAMNERLRIGFTEPTLLI